MTTVDESTFAKAFLHLLGGQTLIHHDDYAPDPASLGPRPGLVLLPPMPTPKRKRTPATAILASITVKSLRPPHFSFTLDDTPYTDTVLLLKSRISEKTDFPAAALKLLLKGKVLPDTKTVEGIVDADGKASLVVMTSGSPITPVVAAASAAGSAAPAEVPASKPEEAVLDDTIDESTWDTISAALMSKLGDAKATKVLDRLRRGYALV
ncbi:uncharacterized protein V1518DRAFT_411732 [Limtongia smithiae]|uniref:uncharacterized protein n=1 Tax=Limtongia smithiae TaxID=1125753 RepID=UPI0034CE235B